MTASIQGLSQQEARARLVQYGPNSVAAVSHAPLWLQFLLRFRNPLVILLLFASLLSALTGDVASFVIITTIVFSSVTLGFFQEMRAEKTITSLQKQVAVSVSVMRDGQILSVPASQIVPGDIVKLQAGSLIPADGELIEGKDIYVNQALLTGESFPLEKNVGDKKTNQLLMGTSVISGSGLMSVLITGKKTQLGQMTGLLGRAHPQTDFERGIEKFGMLILRIAIMMVLFVLLINTVMGRPMLESFLFALALAVGLTPELLPMIMTITLSRGALRMAKNAVITKHLPAMHNLGAMNILCTDKTGTLTEANISLVKTINAQGEDDPQIFFLAFLNSHFESGIKSPLDDAILAHEQPEIKGWQKIDEIPYDFERKRISVLVSDGKTHYLIVKGAPEEIIPLCADLSAAQKKQCLTQFEALGDDGYRALAIAYKEVEATHQTATISDETQLIFSGFATFLDPPKMEAAKTLEQLKKDGIQIKIITGDNEQVTLHVCKMLNFDVGQILTGDAITQLTDDALQRQVQATHVFCRITPQQKNRIILALQAQGNTVGFLGDGINDAAALHVADVGISVDTAADPAKEAADIILLKHDLSVIHRGVIEGRRAVINTKKYILMGSSSNFGNMFSMTGAVLFLPFLPMLPTQILLNNLLYDISQTAIPFDRVDPKALSKPVHWDMKQIKRFMGVLGPISSIFDFLTFYVLLKIFNANEVLFHTGWFVESMTTQVLIIFSIRTAFPIFTSRPHPFVIAMALLITAIAIALPYTPLNTYLGFTPLHASFYMFLSVALIAYFSLVELIKWRLFNPKK